MDQSPAIEDIFLRLDDAISKWKSNRDQAQSTEAIEKEVYTRLLHFKYIVGKYGVDEAEGNGMAWCHSEPTRLEHSRVALELRQAALERRWSAEKKERCRQRFQKAEAWCQERGNGSLIMGGHERSRVSSERVHIQRAPDFCMNVSGPPEKKMDAYPVARDPQEELHTVDLTMDGADQSDQWNSVQKSRVMEHAVKTSAWAPRVPEQSLKNHGQKAHEDTKENLCAADGKPSGFESAKTGYMRHLQKEGKKPPKSFGSQQKKKAAAPSTEHKFVPPHVRKAIQGMNGDVSSGKAQGKSEQDEGPMSIRTYDLLQLTPGEPLPDELSKIDPAMIEQVCNEVIDSSASVAWDDIAGQEAAKRLIQEVVVWPMMNPDIFKGARAPPKGILLFGPPGTGKTLLGKAIASNIEASFFAISASSLTSKWIGDGEKMVKALFAVAGWMAPSVIFIDEIDSLLSARKSEGEHESSRRLKTEILVQMEGCDPASATRKVLLVGATNRPEELDEAARRRMPKQMYIPLPCEKARKEMILRTLGPGGTIAAQLSESDVDKIVTKTRGYSGSDMKNLIQEACQGPIREAVRNAGAQVSTLREKDLRPVVIRDFAVAAKAQRASTEPAEIVRYEEYNEKHGAKTVEDTLDSMHEDDDW